MKVDFDWGHCSQTLRTHELPWALLKHIIIPTFLCYSNRVLSDTFRGKLIISYYSVATIQSFNMPEKSAFNGKHDEEDFMGPFQAGSPKVNDFFQEVLKIGLGFRAQPEVREDPRPTPQSVQFSDLPRTGAGYKDLLDEFRHIARGSVHWGSPNWVGFPDSGNSVPSLGAALMVPLLGQNLCNQDVTSPAATFTEMEVVHWLRSNLGYNVPNSYQNSLEIGGILTVGGSLSNAVALIAAREALFPGSGVDGLPVLPKDIRVLVPDVIEHYSIRSALSSLSLGGANVVRVPVDDNFRIILPELERCIDEERAAGRHVMACVAYAGDSRTSTLFF